MLISMLLLAKSGENKKEMMWLVYNVFNNNELRTSLIFGIFANNYDVGDLQTNYERHFVNKIQR